jgi:hypothetical protein
LNWTPKISLEDHLRKLIAERKMIGEENAR